jgi:hypothetical protein
MEEWKLNSLVKFDKERNDFTYTLKGRQKIKNITYVPFEQARCEAEHRCAAITPELLTSMYRLIMQCQGYFGFPEMYDFDELAKTVGGVADRLSELNISFYTGYVSFLPEPE